MVLLFMTFTDTESKNLLPYYLWVTRTAAPLPAPVHVVSQIFRVRSDGVQGNQLCCDVARSLLTKIRVRTGVSLGNQIHSVNLWTLGIPKMYMGTLGYNIQILH